MKNIHDRMKILILLYAIFASCCATRYNGNVRPDSDLEAMVDHFTATCDSHGLDCSTKRERPSIGLGKMPDKMTLGMCHVIGVMGIYIMPSIVIGYEVIAYSMDQIKIVVYHELIHCYFFIDHHPGDTPHIMRTYSLSQSEIDELGGVEKILNDFFIEYKSNKGLYDTL